MLLVNAEYEGPWLDATIGSHAWSLEHFPWDIRSVDTCPGKLIGVPAPTGTGSCYVAPVVIEEGARWLEEVHSSLPNDNAV